MWHKFIGQQVKRLQYKIADSKGFEHVFLVTFDVMQFTYLQCTTRGPFASWSWDRTFRRKSSKDVASSGTSLSGQAVKWNWYTGRDTPWKMQMYLFGYRKTRTPAFIKSVTRRLVNKGCMESGNQQPRNSPSFSWIIQKSYIERVITIFFSEWK